MDNNFKFKTRYVSIVQRSFSVVNSFVSSVELIQAMTYKLKRDTNQNFETELTYNFKKNGIPRQSFKLLRMGFDDLVYRFLHVVVH